MTDQTDITTPEENFAELLEAFSPGTRSEVRVGDRVKGKVISIGKDTVFVDAGMKIDAVVSAASCSIQTRTSLVPKATNSNYMPPAKTKSACPRHLRIGGAQILEAHRKPLRSRQGHKLQVRFPGRGPAAPRLLPVEPDRLEPRGGPIRARGRDLPVSGHSL
jgi:hypothetical protein